MVKKLIMFIISIAILISTVSAFTPISGSPLANHEHPRLLITQDSLTEIRSSIAADLQLRNKYQDYVNWASEQTASSKDNDISIVGHQILNPQMISQALVAQIGEVSGVTFPSGWTSQRYAEVAFDTMNDQLNAGETLGFAAPLVYDWTHDFITDSKRNSAAQRLASNEINHEVFTISLNNPELSPEQMFSSKYVEGMYPFFIGLALWGDGYVDTLADNAVDTFYDDMLNYGYFDGNALAGAEGGFNEWIGYGSWHPKNHMVFVDGWRTATGEDYVSGKNIRVAPKVENNQLKNYATFIQYAIDPHRYVNEPSSPDDYDQFTFIKAGAASTTDTSLDHEEKRQELWYYPGLLYNAGLITESALARGFRDRYMVKWVSYSQGSVWPFMGSSGITAPTTTPEAENFPESYWARNHGTFFARTGFISEADTVFSATDSHYRYSGHNGADDFPGFSLNKFGPLVNTRYVAHRGYGNLDGYDGAFRDNIINFGVEEKYKEIDDVEDVKNVVTGDTSYDLGGIEQVTFLNEKVYHVTTNRDRALPSGIHHVREYLFLPGDNSELDSDFLIIYDRTSSSNTPEWNIHVPWEPTGSGYFSTSSMVLGSGETGRIGTRYSGTDIIIKELNGLGGDQDADGVAGSFTGGSGAHGVLFSKTLLPRNADVEVTRVAEFDNDVYKRQGNLAIKSHRWQVTTIPKDGTSTFLHVMQTGEESRHTSMTDTNYLDAGSMEGTFILSENSGRPNSIVLFNKNDGAYTNQFSYTITGSGLTRHAIANLQPNTKYEVVDSMGNTFFVDTVSSVERWDYKGAKDAVQTGTLYFETTLSGTHTFTLRPEGSATVTCSDVDNDTYQVASDGSTACGVIDCNDNNQNIHPDAIEICDNNVDDDCDGIADNCLAQCTDNDNDGYGTNCALGTDCDDENAELNTFISCTSAETCETVLLCSAVCPPLYEEVCNDAFDNDCDGLVDEGCSNSSLDGDANGDGTVDLIDLTIVSVSYGLTSEDSGFNPQADVNDDNKVDLFDITIVSLNYGTSGEPLSSVCGNEICEDDETETSCSDDCVISEPPPPPAGEELIISDDFEGTSTVADPFLGSSASTITTEEARSGTHSLKMCAGESCKFSYRQTLPESGDVLYSRYWFKVGNYQSWYNNDGTPKTEEHYKNPGFEGGNEECKGGDHVGDDCLTVRSRLVTPNYGVWLEGSMGYAQGLDETINVIDDEWHCLETKVQLNTPGQSDGEVIFWVDGNEHSMKNYNFRGTNTWTINKWWWTYWSNDAWIGPTYVDDWAVGKTRIGCYGNESLGD